MEDVTEEDDDGVFDENNDYESIKAKCNQLVSSEKIEKSEALEILNLFHEAEKKYLEMLFVKQKEIDTLKNELVVVRLTHKSADHIQSLTQDVSKHERNISSLTSTVEQLNSQMSHVLTKIKK